MHSISPAGQGRETACADEPGTLVTGVRLEREDGGRSPWTSACPTRAALVTARRKHFPSSCCADASTSSTASVGRARGDRRPRGLVRTGIMAAPQARRDPLPHDEHPVAPPASTRCCTGTRATSTPGRSGAWFTPSRGAGWPSSRLEELPDPEPLGPPRGSGARRPDRHRRASRKGQVSASPRSSLSLLPPSSTYLPWSKCHWEPVAHAERAGARGCSLCSRTGSQPGRSAPSWCSVTAPSGLRRADLRQARRPNAMPTRSGSPSAAGCSTPRSRSQRLVHVVNADRQRRRGVRRSRTAWATQARRSRVYARPPPPVARSSRAGALRRASPPPRTARPRPAPVEELRHGVEDDQRGWRTRADCRRGVREHVLGARGPRTASSSGLHEQGRGVGSRPRAPSRSEITSARPSGHQITPVRPRPQ